MNLKLEISKKIKNGFLGILEKFKFWKWNVTIWTTILEKVVPVVALILLALGMFINAPVKEWLWNIFGVTYPMWVAILGYWCFKRKVNKIFAYGMFTIGFGMMVFYAAHKGAWFKDFGAQTFFDEFFFKTSTATMIDGAWVEAGKWVGVDMWANGGLLSVFLGVILGTWFGKGFGVFVALAMLFIGAWKGFDGIKKWLEKKLGFKFRGGGWFREWLEEMLGGREVVVGVSEYEEEEIAPRVDGDITYFPPSLECLNELAEDDDENLEKRKDRSREVEKVLGSLNINSVVVDVKSGPTLTRYELEVGEETQAKNVRPLEDDLAMRLSAKKVRVEAPIPGTNLVGIELPNEKRDVVGLRELICLGNRNNVLELPIGRDVVGEPFYIDFKDIPHLLVAGSTGSGKSVCIHSLIVGLLYKASYMNVKMILIDPKRVEFSLYKGIPHLMRPIVTETKEAIEVFEWATEEMDRRYAEFERATASNIDDFIEEGGQMERIFIFVEEFADLMQTSNKEIEGYIQRLAQKGRASGIHLIMATQRPDSKTIISPIKTNFLNRIVMSVSSHFDSKVALGANGAEQLLGNGDMLYTHNGGAECFRVQGCLVTPREIKCVVADVIDKNPVEKIVAEKPKVKRDEFYEEARALVIDRQKASAKMLRDEFGIGTERASKLLEALEKDGIVGPSVGTRPRKVLVERSDFANIFGEDGD